MASKNQDSKGSESIKKAQGISNPHGRLLSLKEASQILNLSTWNLRERVWNGDLPYIKFPGGRKIYLDVRDLEAFITRNKTTFE